MNFTKLAITNFLTIGKSELELDDRGLLLIQGENEDDPSASSNGAGKSSIVDALCWAIYGVTARGVTGDDVINDTAKKNCNVGVFIEDGDKRYRIHRYRKDATHKNQVFVFQHDNATGVETDMSKGTDRETQEIINQVMGCSLDVFMAAVYAGQEKMPDLPGMTDKMLKTLIEEAAGVEVLTEAYSLARTRHNTAKTLAESLLAEHARATSGELRLKDELVAHRHSLKEFEDGRRDRARAELSKVLPLTKIIADAEIALTTWDESATRKELDECQSKIDATKGEKLELERLEDAARVAQREADKVRTLIEVGKRDIAKCEVKIVEIDDHVGKPCGECGRPYHAEDLETARRTQAEALRGIKTSLVPVVAAFKAATDAANTTSDVAAKFKAGMTDVTSVAQRQRELSNLLNAIDATKREIASARKDIDAIKASANAKLTETNPMTSAVKSKTDEIERAVLATVNLAGRLDEITSEAEILADAVKVFGPAGVRAHILDTVTPYLNDRTQDYLGALTDGNIHATWATLSKTAKGDLKEKFNIEVTNDKGAKSFAGLSGGEKRKVRLATAMALQDMVASRATKPIGMWIGDEIDHALDEAGLERLMTILERKARERGTVLVISHQSLGDWIDNVITVTKSGGFATATGATERGF